MNIRAEAKENLFRIAQEQGILSIILIKGPERYFPRVCKTAHNTLERDSTIANRGSEYERSTIRMAGLPASDVRDKSVLVKRDPLQSPMIELARAGVRRGFSP